MKHPGSLGIIGDKARKKDLTACRNTICWIRSPFQTGRIIDLHRCPPLTKIIDNRLADRTSAHSILKTSSEDHSLSHQVVHLLGDWYTLNRQAVRSERKCSCLKIGISSKSTADIYTVISGLISKQGCNGKSAALLQILLHRRIDIGLRCRRLRQITFNKILIDKSSNGLTLALGV